MKKFFVVSVWIVIMGLFAIQVLADQEYDSEMVIQVMNQSTAFWEQFNNAIEEQDYFTAAVSLMGIAKAIKSLESMIPAKGSKEDWDEIHQDLIKTAFKGIGACGDEDAKEVRAYGDQIRLLMQMGHKLFQ